VFICIGNHDAGIYYHDAQTDGNIHTMTGEYLYQNFTAYSESENTVVGGAEYGGYCYRDFTDKKLRVIMLNTSEKLTARQIDNTTFGAQRLWLANALLDLNNKTDAAEWGFIILSHYPADYGATMPLSRVLEAYVKGSSVSIKDPADSDYYKGDGTNQTVSFAGKNGAKFISQFHGHIHNFLYSKLYSDASGSAAQYEAWRMCIPNGQFNRENTYGTIGDINYKEDKTYTKTVNTANGTSFVINVINPSEEKIYSFRYGAGYDRVIGYGAETYYSITYDLTNVEMLNKIYGVKEGEPLSVSVDSASIADGYDVTTARVVMGGIDITSSAYNNGQISITNVTGNVIITIKAKLHENFTNQIPISIALDSNSVYNGKGYKEDTYITSAGTDNSKSGYYSTGLIPAVKGDVIRLEDFGFVKEDEYSRFCFYNANKEYIMILGADNLVDSFKSVYDNNNHLIEFTLGTSYANDMAYFRICGQHICDDSVITKNEEITYGDNCAITYNLTNVTTSNNVTSVKKGSNYTASLYADSGYNLTSVTITMSGVDITSSVYGGGMMSFTVTGNVVITAIAEPLPVNLVTLATTTDGVTPFGEDYNGDGVADGYQKGMALGSGSEYTTSEYANAFTTGWITCNPKYKTITLKNFGTEAVNYSKMRIVTYARKNFDGAMQALYLQDLPKDSEGNIVVSPSAWTSTTTVETACIRVSGKWTGSAPEIYAE
jgi:hypothetical protein